MPLSRELFLEIIDSVPLVAIDLLVWDDQERLLLGQRVNPPAQGFWFVPGGRIYKDERLADAFRRITAAELGQALELSDASFYGVYEHLYPDNFANAPGISTHYVVLAYQIHLVGPELSLPTDQHQAYRWQAVDELLRAEDVHPNTKAYFQKT